MKPIENFLSFFCSRKSGAKLGQSYFFHVVFLVILQISTCKNFATKHTIPQNTEIFGFLGSKYQIITRLVHQNENRPYKVSKYPFKWFFFAKAHVKSQETKLDKLKYPKTHKFASKQQKNYIFLILTCYTTQMDAMGNS